MRARRKRISSRALIIICGTALASLTVGLTAAWGRWPRPPQRQTGDEHTATPEERRQAEQRMTEVMEALKSADVKVVSNVSGIGIVNVEKHPELLKYGAVKVQLRNDSPKTITGFTTWIGEHATSYTELRGGLGGGGWRPGETRDDIYPFQPGVEKEGIQILAAIYDDRTAEGADSYVNEIRTTRMATKVQRSHEVDLLRRALARPESTLGGSLAGIIDEESAGAEQDESGLPATAVSAMRGERGWLIQMLQEMLQDPSIVAGDMVRRGLVDERAAPTTLQSVLTLFTQLLSDGGDKL
jgi:hypothetical protein